MKLAFSGDAHYTDFSKGYELYKKRSRKGESVDEKTYNNIVRDYCSTLADRLFTDGMVDLPELGILACANITRKAQYRGDKFIGYGGIDWKNKKYDGKLKTFGIVFLPKTRRKQNLRCYGFVANRRLFKKIKERHYKEALPMLDYNDEMI